MKRLFFLPKYLLLLLIGFALLISCSGCKKFVDIKPSANLIQSEDLFSDEASALSAVSGVYVQMRFSSPGLANGALSVYAGLTADELMTSTASSEYEAFLQNSILPNSGVVEEQLWSDAYKVIYTTNLIIENLEKSTGLSMDILNQLTGEMLVVRSLYYFYLINLFGDVPLITSSDYSKNEHEPRTPVDNVYTQIITDLQAAENMLSENSQSYYKTRPNKYMAAALLSKVYLFKDDWANAASEASKVINAGTYSLEPDLNNVFKKASNETIWQIASPNEMYNSAEGNIFIPYSSTDVPTVYITNSLLHSFEAGDERKESWLGMNTVSGTTYYFPFKYKSMYYDPVDEYEIVFRLAEAYLTRAEAMAHENKIEDALNDINMIRNRAGLSAASASGQQALLNIVMAERQRELFAENGNRWLDLKRTGLINSVLSVEKPEYWQLTDTLYPIPFNQIQINTTLVQNPGY